MVLRGSALHGVGEGMGANATLRAGTLPHSLPCAMLLSPTLTMRCAPGTRPSTSASCSQSQRSLSWAE